jgi:transposase
LKNGCSKIVFAYEASASGFGLYDFLTAAGFECHVLAPSKIPTSAHDRKRKTDDRDALKILQEVRNHVLAGGNLPSIWIPDKPVRDDRELIRARLELKEKQAEIQNQIQSLLKRHRIIRPANMATSWSKKHLRWLEGSCKESLPRGAAVVLLSMVRQYGLYRDEISALDTEIEALSKTPMYAAGSRELIKIHGVGLLTAMVFLTELGDLQRFKNRRQLGAYLGLAPSAHESGMKNDRKGHITRSGSPRIRKVLCQAVWARIRAGGPGRPEYERIQRGEKQRNKIAVVALMRRLAIRMWHCAMDASVAASDSAAA